MPDSLPVFHACTVKYSGIVNRIVTEALIFKFFDPQNPPNPPESPCKIKALWDTGATGSVVTKSTVKALYLKPIGSVTVNHAGGSSQSNTYLVNIVLPNKVMITGVTVTECADLGNDCGAIIGMNIIAQGDFSITNNKKTCMTFRIPSVQEIDYVEEAKRLKTPHISRSAPCPCGSGKKYKRCCGKDK